MTVERTASPRRQAARPAFSSEDLVERWPCARPFVLLALACTVAGGIVAAVSRPADLGHGPWAAAFLVLVLGVAQLALGGGQAWIAADIPQRSLVRWQLLTWNAGGAAVIVGTLTAVPALTSAGGLVEVVALVLFLTGVRRAGPAPDWARLTFRAVVAVMAVSIPIGLVLAWIHPSR